MISDEGLNFNFFCHDGQFITAESGSVVLIYIGLTSIFSVNNGSLVLVRRVALTASPILHVCVSYNGNILSPS